MSSHPEARWRGTRLKLGLKPPRSRRLLRQLREPRLNITTPKPQVAVDSQYRQRVLLHGAGARARRGHFIHLAFAHFQKMRQIFHS